MSWFNKKCERCGEHPRSCKCAERMGAERVKPSKGRLSPSKGGRPPKPARKKRREVEHKRDKALDEWGCAIRDMKDAGTFPDDEGGVTLVELALVLAFVVILTAGSMWAMGHDPRLMLQVILEFDPARMLHDFVDVLVYALQQ